MGMVENLKDVVKLVQKLDNIELQEKLLGLQSDMLELLDQKGKVEQRNRSLEEQVQTLKLQQITAGELLFENDCYWRTTEEPRTPYCSRCWDAEKTLVRMHRRVNGVAGCPSCKTMARAWPDESKPPTPRGVRTSRYLSTRGYP